MDKKDIIKAILSTLQDQEDTDCEGSTHDQCLHKKAVMESSDSKPKMAVRDIVVDNHNLPLTNTH